MSEHDGKPETIINDVTVAVKDLLNTIVANLQSASKDQENSKIFPEGINLIYIKVTLPSNISIEAKIGGKGVTNMASTGESE